MPSIRHLAFLAGIMGAEEAQVHPDALAAAAEALVTGLLPLPDGSEAHISFENEGHWWRTDWQGNAALSTLHRGPGDDSWTTELIALHFGSGGHLDMAALAAALRMAPIVVTVVDTPDANSSRLCDIASWIGLALLQGGEEGRE